MEGGYGARVYDAVYRWKDYDAEAARLREILAGREGGSLLDVACGTGNHLVRLREAFRAEGLEKDPEMAALARAKGLTVHEGDMEGFDLGRRFDVVTCLFSSIGYVETPERLGRAVATMARHLAHDGLLLIEPWFAPEQWRDGYAHADFVDDEGLKIARMSVSKTDGAVSLLDLHHMVATPEGVETFTTHHRLGLFADWEYEAAFRAAGLEVERDEKGLMGRGLYIARRNEP
jgi:SAM-dependent methyltransferase